MTPLSGLTSAEALERMRRGLANRTPRSHVREYAQIVGRNLGTWFNAMVTPAAVSLFALGDVRGAVAVSGMAIVNTVLALAQEINAKIHLDKLSLLVEAKARVVRDGQIHHLPASDVVQDDCIVLQAGDTVVADGPVLDAQFLEIDEALLTGESDPIRRRTGDRLLSGSICIAGEGRYCAENVGLNSFANQTSTEARRFHFTLSPLTLVINRIVRVLTYTAIFLCLVHLAAYFWLDITKTDAVQRVAATITSMVPQGMVLAATISFIVGALAMSRRGAIVQRLNAVETMASIDVICTDKTGTLTTNSLQLKLLQPLDANQSETAIRADLRAFAWASIDRTNRNIEALRRALGEVAVDRIDQLPFKSQNRYSAIRLKSPGGPRLFVLGAPETLDPRLNPPVADIAARVSHLQHRGIRMLLFAEGPGEVALDSMTHLSELPLKPLALVGLTDELRPNVGAVLESLNAQGIQFKVISGDNPDTVKGTVSHLNLAIARDPAVSGDDLERATDPASLIRERSIFGRVSPHQKVQIVETLKKMGYRVAMIGDGVNDVLPIKRADLGIAMGSGSQASKKVSGIVLENDRFELLPETLEEGRTIVRNLRRSGKLFLVKNIYSLILILASYLIVIPFPYVPQQVTLLNWTVIGIPALAIAMSRERSTSALKQSFFRELAHFALRTGVVFGLGGTLLLRHAAVLYPDHTILQRTLFLSLLIVLGITVLFRALRDGDSGAARGDRRFRLLGMLAIPVFLTAMYVPHLAHFFDLAPLGLAEWAMVLAYAAPCWIVTIVADRLPALSKA